MLKTWVGCLHFTFTIAGSHIDWALTKNEKCAVDITDTGPSHRALAH